jgi:general secretion pathway protein E/type IV pilus assembly protein PilB
MNTQPQTGMSQDYFELETTAQQFLRPEQAFHYQIVPKQISSKTLSFFVDELHYRHDLEDELELVFGLPVSLERTDSRKVQKTLTRYYRRRKDQPSRALTYSGGMEADFLQDIIQEANQMGSSDIHFEPYDNTCRVRIRIDGKLVERYEVKMEDYPAMVNKIKIKGNLDIAEKRLPQDGRIEFREAGMRFDIRVSVLPTLHGEKVVMRLLSRDALNIELESLGFNEQELATYTENIRKPNGIVLISGPTGSGKTTTLYATLKLLNKETSNILTIEDPIEYTLAGINQVQLKESIGLDFAAAMRTFLRQDPDIIMLGEIRDKDTAQMAIRAALTGHLVFSTIHTNSAWGTVTRLIDMGVPPFLISNTLNLSVAQRLVRTLCPSCKREEPLRAQELPRGLKDTELPKTHFVPIGCSDCYYTGYQGRQAIYELIPMDRELAEAIKQERDNVEDMLKEREIALLADRAFSLMRSGSTSLEEVYSILMQ